MRRFLWRRKRRWWEAAGGGDGAAAPLAAAGWEGRGVAGSLQLERSIGSVKDMVAARLARACGEEKRGEERREEEGREEASGGGGFLKEKKNNGTRCVFPLTSWLPQQLPQQQRCVLLY